MQGKGTIVVLSAGTSDIHVAKEACLTAKYMENNVEAIFDVGVAGMVSKPIIAVLTSIGYGVNLGGLTALFAMLNSCSSNIAVVNIDNGFGAGYMASVINRVIAYVVNNRTKPLILGPTNTPHRQNVFTLKFY